MKDWKKEFYKLKVCKCGKYCGDTKYTIQEFIAKLQLSSMQRMADEIEGMKVDESKINTGNKEFDKKLTIINEVLSKVLDRLKAQQLMEREK